MREKCLHLSLNGRRERTAFLSGQQRGQTGDIIFVLADVFFIYLLALLFPGAQVEPRLCLEGNQILGREDRNTVDFSSTLEQQSVIIFIQQDSRQTGDLITQGNRDARAYRFILKNIALSGKQLQHIGKFRLSRTVKAIKLRGTAAFCSVFISAGFDEIPEFAAKVRGQSFHQKDDVQIFRGTKGSVLRFKNQVAGGTADQDILVLEVLKVVAKYRNPFHGK